MFGGEEQVSLVRPYGEVLHVALLNYNAEIRDAAEVGVDEPQIRDVEKQVDLAETLIWSWKNDRYGFADYTSVPAYLKATVFHLIRSSHNHSRSESVD